MLLAAPLRGCRHGRRAFLPASLPTVVKASSSPSTASFPHFKRFYADPSHDAKVAAIRNIGIIAHVDAVSDNAVGFNLFLKKPFSDNSPG